MYKRVLLKLSGEALKNGKDAILDPYFVKLMARKIKELHDFGTEIAIVIGGGNIWRGSIGETLGFERVNGDYMGMLSTVINAVALSSSLNNMGVHSKVYSALAPIEGVTLPYETESIKKDLKNGVVCFLAGGTGKPYFSTDTAAALRAIENECDVILMAKNGVDGVYDDDPRKNNKAKLLKDITYKDILNLKLKVMDLDAVNLLKDTNLEILVFSMDNMDNFNMAVSGKNIGTRCRRSK